jgi:diguanylate cyclase (GGDEF)-like protein
VFAAGILMLAGGTIGLLTAALPPAAERSELAVAAAAALALGVGAALVLVRRRIGNPVLGAIVALGTLLITLGTYQAGGGTGTADNEMLYVWICLYSFYFFSLPHALGQLALVGLAYGALLTTAPDADEALSRWIVTMSTLLVAGLIVARLRTAVGNLVGELTERAHVDSLTGALNRRGLEERAALELARARREGTPVSMLAVDVDHFKSLNDGYGHGTGDAVLRFVAAEITRVTRAVDAVARLGGDEFVVILPGADADDAAVIAKRLRNAVLGGNDAEIPPVTLSIGVASSSVAEATLEQVWHAADLAMYEAKRAGGNGVHRSTRAITASVG